MYTTNDLILYNLCSNILDYPDRYQKYSGSLAKYNLDIDAVKDSPVLFFNVMTYRLLEEYFKTFKPSLNKLEKQFNKIVWSRLTPSRDNLDLAAKCWVRFTKLYSEISNICNSYSKVAGNLPFQKSVRRVNLTIHGKIDILMVNKGGVDLLTVVPLLGSSKQTSGLLNFDTLLCLDYLLEANLNINKVISIEYDRGRISRDFVKKEFFVTDQIVSFVKEVATELEPAKPNLFLCSSCDYRKQCTLRKIRKGI